MVAGGEGFPQRGLVLFLAFSVILATVIVQGVTLPGLIRLLGLRGDTLPKREEAEARLAAARAALARLNELARERGTRPEAVAWLRTLYESRARRAEAQQRAGGAASQAPATKGPGRRLISVWSLSAPSGGPLSTCATVAPLVRRHCARSNGTSITRKFAWTPMRRINNWGRTICSFSRRPLSERGQ